jgi:CheY-like chemotaxis protein
VSAATPKRVLVVEDEPLVAIMLEDMLAELGYGVVGPASRIIQALELAETGEFEVALLDININAGRSYVVADVLRARGVPFFFATGYGPAGLDERHGGAPVLQKPYRKGELDRVLRELLDGGAARTAAEERSEGAE